MMSIETAQKYRVITTFSRLICPESILSNMFAPETKRTLKNIKIYHM